VETAAWRDGGQQGGTASTIAIDSRERRDIKNGANQYTRPTDAGDYDAEEHIPCRADGQRSAIVGHG
jgi:hypothetical protein